MSKVERDTSSSLPRSLQPHKDPSSHLRTFFADWKKRCNKPKVCAHRFLVSRPLFFPCAWTDSEKERRGLLLRELLLPPLLRWNGKGNPSTSIQFKTFFPFGVRNFFDKPSFLLLLSSSPSPLSSSTTRYLLFNPILAISKRFLRTFDCHPFHLGFKEERQTQAIKA